MACNLYRAEKYVRFRMSMNGPAYMGLWRERTAAAENIQRILTTIEKETAQQTVPQLAVQLEILDGYWLRFQDVQRNLLVDFAHIDEISATMGDIEHNTQQIYATAKSKLMQLHSQLSVEPR